METSVMVAQIAALVYLSVGLGFYLNRDFYKKEFSKMLDNAGVMYLGGWMALIAGYLLVTFHNIWVWDWTVLVTIIGWIALVKGVWLLLLPKTVRIFKPLVSEKNIGKWMIFPLILGLVFAYFGFFA